VETPADLVAFIEREQPRLVRAAHLLVGDRAVAEEIAQETLLRAASRWGRVSRMGSPGGWAHRVTINLATSQLRRRRIERRVHARIAGSQGTTASRGGHGTVHVGDTAQAVEVRRALASLPEAARRRLVLRYVLDWSAEQIGDLEGASEATVRQRLHRARAAMRDALGPGFNLSDDETPPSASNREGLASGDDRHRVSSGATHEETRDVR
jgi:RNA polymerase sigma-70 factor, ECF subfamily